MSAKGVIYILAAVVIAVLVVANWSLLSGTVELHLLIARFQAPLALLLLLFAAIMFLVSLSVQTLREYAWRRERRTLATALEEARLVAEKEEASRTGALKAALQSELATIRAQLDRVLSMQASTLQASTMQSSTLERATAIRPAETLEPELVPPREARGRGPY